MRTQQEQESARRSSTRTAAIMELRFGFKMHGFDVEAYADDQVSGAIVAEATADTYSSKDLFSRAFERLKKNSS